MHRLNFPQGHSFKPIIAFTAIENCWTILRKNVAFLGFCCTFLTTITGCYNSDVPEGDCSQFLSTVLERDETTGELWINRAIQLRLRTCGNLDELDTEWLVQVHLPKIEREGPEGVTFQDLVKAVEQYRLSPNYHQERVALREWIWMAGKQYSEDTWPRARGFFLAMGMTREETDELQAFMQLPENEGIRYGSAGTEYLNQSMSEMEEEEYDWSEEE